MDADRALTVRAVAAHLARGISDIRQTPVAVIPTKRNAGVNQEGNKLVITQQREQRYNNSLVLQNPSLV